MTLESLFLALDRIAGGRTAAITIPEDMRQHPRTRRSFVWITWLLAAELLIGSAAVVSGRLSSPDFSKPMTKSAVFS